MDDGSEERVDGRYIHGASAIGAYMTGNIRETQNSGRHIHCIQSRPRSLSYVNRSTGG